MLRTHLAPTLYCILALTDAPCDDCAGTNVGTVFTELSSRILKDVKGKEGSAGATKPTQINVQKKADDGGCKC